MCASTAAFVAMPCPRTGNGQRMSNERGRIITRSTERQGDREGGAGRKGDGAHSGCAAQWRQSPVRSETRAMATRRVARRCGLHMAISPQGAEHHAHEWHACSVVIAVHRAPVGDCQVLDRHNALHRSAAQQAAQASIATRVLHRLHALGWAERVRAEPEWRRVQG